MICYRYFCQHRTCISARMGQIGNGAVFVSPGPDGCLVADQHQKEKPGVDQARAVVGTVVVSLQRRIPFCDGQVFFC